MRLGHIAFMGMAAVNVGFGLTVRAFGMVGVDGGLVEAGSVLFLIGGVGMPAVCLLSAWRKGWRHAFALPVVAVGGGCACAMGVVLGG